MRILLTLLLLTCTAQAQVGLNLPAPPTGTNFVYVEQVGDGNIITVDQMESDEKKAAVILQGQNNQLQIWQSGTGNHTAIINQTNNNSQNNNNILSIVQGGSGAHSATIMLNNATNNSNNSASITQAGNTGAEKQFTLTLTGSGIGATVIQDNLLTKDTGSMSITCNSPPCTGYSYIKH